MPLLGALNTEILTGAVRPGACPCSELAGALTGAGRPWGGVGWGRQEGGCPVSAHPLGHLPELKGYFSVFSCSYGEGSPAVVSSCFSSNCRGEEGGVLALCRWDSSPPAQYGGRWSGSSTNQSRRGLFEFLCSPRADGEIRINWVGGSGVGLPCEASLRTTRP